LIKIAAKEHAVPEIIRMGDPTSHGGRVVEGSASDICQGKPIAFIGHKTFCPLCKGSFPIVEGSMSTTFYGRGVALAGMKTACRAVLIATQHTDFVTPSSHSSTSSRTADQGPGVATTQSKATDNDFDLVFLITDLAGVALMDCPYRIETKSGEKIDGRTNSEGMTTKIASKQAEQATLHVYEPATTPINPAWDR
jgi:uncharacterized Zn-binding protein involved in type VI secretion